MIFHASTVTWVAALLLAVHSVGFASTDLPKQRKQFQEAEKALKLGQRAQFQQKLKALKTYPLYPYLVFEDLRLRLHTLPAADIQDFLTRYADSPLAARLSYGWLETLAQQQKWQNYLDTYTSRQDTALRCYQLRALYHTGDQGTALQQAERLWLTGNPQPQACNPLFDLWRESGGLTAEHAWQRFQLAMNAGQYALASYLTRYLTPEQTALAELWTQVINQPDLILSHPQLQIDEEAPRQIVAFGVRRLARQDASGAWKTWLDLKSRYRFSAEDRTAVERRLILAQAIQRTPEFVEGVSMAPETENLAEIREWRVRQAIFLEDWEMALAWLGRLPEDSQEKSVWRYWRARTLEATGKTEEARVLYTELAGTQGYYGFLASDRLDLPYRVQHQARKYKPSELSSVEKRPAVARARELYYLGRAPEARSEWSMAIRNMNPDELTFAAKLAHQWGWHDRGALTAARIPLLEDLSLRFPLGHREYIMEQTRKQNINPAWAFAVIRQESAFMPDARSEAGALGMMQIMPQTGQIIAKQLKMRMKGEKQLLDARTNIRFGVTYLRDTLKSFSDNVVLATAAYNAGGSRVKRWMPNGRQISADIWVEAVPFSETRGYLNNVLAYTAIYEHLLGQRQISLKRLMLPIGKPVEELPQISINNTPGNS